MKSFLRFKLALKSSPQGGSLCSGITGSLYSGITGSLYSGILTRKRVCIYRKNTLDLTLVLSTVAASGQNTFKKNTLYFEAGGNGVHGSVNYERQFSHKPGFGARIGVGLFYENPIRLTIPLGFNYLLPLKNERSFIDIGLGATWTAKEAFYILKFSGKSCIG